MLGSSLDLASQPDPVEVVRGGFNNNMTMLSGVFSNNMTHDNIETTSQKLFNKNMAM